MSAVGVGNQIAIGTKQYLLVDIIDLSGTVTDLASHSPKYTVEDDTDTKLYDDQTATTSGMVVYCLIDTTSGTWVAGHYRLWVRFSIAPENPYLGPFDFYLN